MTTRYFNLKTVDPSWHSCINEALSKMDPHYLNKLLQQSDWLPGADSVFNAFSLPINKVKFILFGESPYPREISANGYAFWDASVDELWSKTGLSKPVNRATSLRNIIKMLLITEGLLTPSHVTQTDIATLDKSRLIKTNHELFNNLLNHGFLLLNISLVLRSTPVKNDAIAWLPFIKQILHVVLQQNPDVQLIMLGKIATTIDQLIDLPRVKKLCAEHPYNLSFIQNKMVLDFFKPLHLLTGTDS